MSKVYYEKIAERSRKDTAVTEGTPLPTRAYQGDGEEAVQDVRVVGGHLPPVSGESITRQVQVPGIGTAAAYAAADAFGTIITIPGMFRSNINTGTVTKVVFLDLDDEGIQKDVIFFRRPISTTADNAAYAPTDDDILECDGGLSVVTFFNFSNNQVGVWTGSHWVRSGDTNLYIRLVTQGADNIAAGAIPWLVVTVVPD